VLAALVCTWAAGICSLLPATHTNRSRPPMFRIDPAPTFSCEVRLSRPDADAPVVLKGVFRHQTQRGLDAWSRSVERAVLEGGQSPDQAVLDALAQVVVDLAPLSDADGKLLAYSTDVLAQLLDNFPSAAAEISAQYRRRLADARAKN